jgi:hypothetical protein
MIGFLLHCGFDYGDFVSDGFVLSLLSRNLLLCMLCFFRSGGFDSDLLLLFFRSGGFDSDLLLLFLCSGSLMSSDLLLLFFRSGSLMSSDLLLH